MLIINEKIVFQNQSWYEMKTISFENQIFEICIEGVSQWDFFQIGDAELIQNVVAKLQILKKKLLIWATQWFRLDDHWPIYEFPRWELMEIPKLTSENILENSK